MSHLRVLVVADPTETFQPKYDTTLLLSAELLRRGHEVFYLSTKNFEQQELALNLLALPVQKVMGAYPGKEADYIELTEPESSDAASFDVILQRKDPPVDDLFIKICKFFSKVNPKVLQINNPAEIYLYSEHLLPAQFPHLSVPTKFFEGFEELGRFLSQQPEDEEYVLKPLNSCSGNGIRFFKASSPIAALLEYWKKWGPGIILQPYQKEIESLGDLRVVVMNNQIVGSVMRKLAPGKRLANLHQGATSEYFEPTPQQIKAIEEVAPLLSARGIFLVGFDFIGDLISEINITSPSALVQVNEVMKKQCEIEVIDILEDLVKFERKNKHHDS